VVSNVLVVNLNLVLIFKVDSIVKNIYLISIYLVLVYSGSVIVRNKAFDSACCVAGVSVLARDYV